MLIDTGNSLKLHEHRIAELHKSADNARLAAGVTSKKRSFKLGRPTD